MKIDPYKETSQQNSRTFGDKEKILQASRKKSKKRHKRIRKQNVRLLAWKLLNIMIHLENSEENLFLS